MVPNDVKMQIAGVVLAAGSSSRLGRPKQLLEYEDKSLLRRTAMAAADSELDPLIVVLGSQSDRFISEVCDLPLQVVINERWETGIGSSIRAGIHAIGSWEFDGVAIMAVDQPLVTKEVVGRLTHAFRASGARIVASRYGDTLGVPAIFARALLQSLSEIPDDRGAKGLIAECRGAVFAVDFPEGAFDVDTPRDLERLGAMQRRGPGVAP